MTDTDIIKALECCTTGECVHCPRWKTEYIAGDCADILPKAIDLINRQRAEIERLRNESDELAEQLHNLLIEKDDLFDETERLIKATL